MTIVQLTPVFRASLGIITDFRQQVLSSALKLLSFSSHVLDRRFRSQLIIFFLFWRGLFATDSWQITRAPLTHNETRKELTLSEWNILGTCAKLCSRFLQDTEQQNCTTDIKISHSRHVSLPHSLNGCFSCPNRMFWCNLHNNSYWLDKLAGNVCGERSGCIC